MNKNQRRYLMSEVNRIYIDKDNQIKNKYPTLYLNILTENYIKANKLKLRFKTDEEIIDFLYETIVNNNYKLIYEYLNDMKSNSYWSTDIGYGDLKEIPVWFDISELVEKIRENEEKIKSKRKALEDKLKYIEDKIMFNDTKFIDDKTIEEYIKELEAFEI